MEEIRALRLKQAENRLQTSESDRSVKLNLEETALKGNMAPEVNAQYVDSDGFICTLFWLV